MAVQKDGKIIAAGGSGGAFALVRYSTSGKLDASFGKGGKVLTALGSTSAVALQPDGKIVAVVHAGGPVLVRYTTRGKLDTSFGSDGEVEANLGG